MTNKIRNGLKSIWWHPELVEGAIIDEIGIPFCPTTATEIPEDIITWEEAKIIYRKQVKNGNSKFKMNIFVCFYLDDYKFDTFRGIWFSPKKAFEFLKHFRGIITPDFSTYSDFPLPLRLWNTYRMRAFGYASSCLGIEVINNVRGKPPEDFFYCFNGIEVNSIVAIGTVGSGLKHLENQEGFEFWLNKMVTVLKPHTVIVYGSANYPFFQKLTDQGIRIVAYESKTSRDWKRRKKHV